MSPLQNSCPKVSLSFFTKVHSLSSLFFNLQRFKTWVASVASLLFFTHLVTEGSYCARMYENGKMRPVETIPGIGGRG
jgi:hypothetical protein